MLTPYGRRRQSSELEAVLLSATFLSFKTAFSEEPFGTKMGEPCLQ